VNTMKTLPSETKYTSERQRRRFWLGCFTILLVSPLLLYYGYCWGWWGRQSLLLQHLFQCSCPPASEEARYPTLVEVIVPACQNGGSRLSPSGRLLYVREKKENPTSTYLLNLQTNEKLAFPLSNSAFYFLTDDLLYVISYQDGSEYIWDRTTDERYPIQRFSFLYRDAYVNGNINPNLLADALREARDVFLINDDLIVALSPDFPASSDHNFTTGRFDIARDEQFLREYHIAYQTTSSEPLEEAISPDGRFVAHPDGIYLVGTGEKIVEGYSASRSFRPYSRKYFQVQGWTSDSAGVIYSKLLDPCLIETNFFVFDDYRCYFEVPQPLIKLKVPEKYLLPRETP
jgi:hypothetical protein